MNIYDHSSIKTASALGWKITFPFIRIHLRTWFFLVPLPPLQYSLKYTTTNITIY